VGRRTHKRSYTFGRLGSCHIVTTSLGPENYAGQFWMRVMEGEVRDHAGSPMQPCFIGALERPDRTKAWLDGTRKGTDAAHFKLEYPMTWEDALQGSAERFFNPADVRACLEDCYGPAPARSRHRYVIGVDVGTKDATVIIVDDITRDVHDVVHWVRLKDVTYTQIGYEIERVARAYPTALVVIEDNAAGMAVREHLDIPVHRLEGFKTTSASKGKMLTNLALATEGWLIRWPPQFEQLTNEMLAYRLPDENITQDCVMALAIAEESAMKAHLQVGSILGVWYV